MPSLEASRPTGSADAIPALLPTLAFSDWLRSMDSSADPGGGIDVECGECRGCCTSSYFIPVEPDEKETLAAIPKRLLFPAPGRPGGRRLIGYDENGHCALFRDNACSIYAHRPRACRAYDCRVFAATGLSEGEKPLIAGQAKRWRFAFPAGEDERQLKAVRAAARFLGKHAAEFPAGFLPSQATQMAALAIRIRSLFAARSAGAAEAGETIAEILGLVAAGRASTRRKTLARARKPPSRSARRGGMDAGSG